MAIARRIDKTEIGTASFYDFADVIAGAGPHTLIDTTVANNTYLSISRLAISCRIESIIEVYKNDNVIASLRTGAAQPSDSFDWFPARKLQSGDNLKIKLMKRTGSPDVDVSAHLMGTTIPT